jgi:sulfatase maturation enzyme AslB (radical SAM superfamily)
LNPLCYAPFVGIYVSHKGVYAPCCISKKTAASNLHEYWHGEEMRQTRIKMLKHEWPDSCSVCMHRVDADLESDIESWDEFFEKYPIEINVESGNSTENPLFLEYRPGNECNLKCRMCSPHSSSQIEKEIKDNPEFPELVKFFGGVEPRQEDVYSHLYNFVNEVKVKHLRVLGGEPTLDKSVYAFLTHIVDTYDDLPKLYMTTNATNLNKKFQNLLLKFNRNIKLRFSIDGTGSTYEYIRTNARWDISKNIVENTLSKRIASSYAISVVLTPYNMFNMLELLDWIVELKKIENKIQIHAVNSDSVKTSVAAILPDDMSIYIASIENWIAKNGTSLEGVEDLLSMLKSVKFDKKIYERFKRFNGVLDKIRNTRIVDIDERFARYT